MLPVVKTAPLALPVAPAGGQLHPPRPRAWGLSREWQGLTSSQEEPWTLRGEEGRERERGEKEEREGGGGSEGDSGMGKGHFRKGEEEIKSIRVLVHIWIKNGYPHLRVCWLCVHQSCVH